MPKVIAKSQIFSAAVSIYSKQGYAETSMVDIAKLAKINEVTLYRRYDKKSVLLVAALSDLLSKSAFAKIKYSGDLETDLCDIVSAYIQTNALYGASVFNLMSEISRYEKLRPAASSLLTNTANAAKIIAGHQSAGRLVSGPPLVLLNKLIAPLMMQASYERCFGAIDRSKY